MDNLIPNYSNIKSSSLYTGYLILDEMKKREVTMLSIYDISAILKKNNILSSRQLIFGLTLLYSLEVITFKEPYVCLIE